MATLNESDKTRDDGGVSLSRDDVLSTAETAELLGIPRSTVHYLARRGELPARRVGRRWLFLRDRLAAALVPLDEPGAWHPQNHDLRRGSDDRRLKNP